MLYTRAKDMKLEGKLKAAVARTSTLRDILTRTSDSECIDRWYMQLFWSFSSSNARTEM